MVSSSNHEVTPDASFFDKLGMRRSQRKLARTRKFQSAILASL
jgi:hypothetical protein